MCTTLEDAVFVRDGTRILPTQLARGPWSAGTQHGGAPAGLLARLAEAAVDDPEWLVTRLTVELLRPVPIAPLSVDIDADSGRSVRRVRLTLQSEEAVVAQATALLARTADVELPPSGEMLPLPAPDDCQQRVLIPGMPEVTSFYYTAMEARLARGSVTEPGPAAAWFRFTVPLLNDEPLTSASRAAAAADFGNGISWTLPFDRFLFANTDLTMYLLRPAHGEWIAIDSVTNIERSGVGLTRSALYDEQGLIGVAQQNLLVRAR